MKSRSSGFHHVLFYPGLRIKWLVSKRLMQMKNIPFHRRGEHCSPALSGCNFLLKQFCPLMRASNARPYKIWGVCGQRDVSRTRISMTFSLGEGGPPQAGDEASLFPRFKASSVGFAATFPQGESQAASSRREYGGRAMLAPTRCGDICGSRDEISAGLSSSVSRRSVAALLLEPPSPLGKAKLRAKTLLSREPQAVLSFDTFLRGLITCFRKDTEKIL